MQILVTLHAAQGRVVTRDELLERCWGAVFVAEDSLNRAISEARRALREVGLTDAAIETIPRTGYRWAIPAEQAEGAKPAPSVANPGRRRLLAGGAAACMAAGAGLWWQLRARGKDGHVQALLAAGERELNLNTASSEQKGIALLEEAVALDSNNAEAWGRLTLAIAQSSEHDAPASASPHFARVEEVAGRALRLNPDNADALAGREIARPYYGDWLAAEQRLRAVLARHPGHPAAEDSLSFLLAAVGRIQEGAAMREGIVRRAPLNAAYQHRLVYGLWFQGRIAEADRVAARGLETWPRHPGLWFGHLWVLANTGRLDRAIARVANAETRPPMPQPIVDTLRMGLLAAQSRRATDIEQASASILKQVEASPAAVVSAMMVLNIMGALDTAFDVAHAYYLDRGPILADLNWRPGTFSLPDQRRRKSNMLFVPTARVMQNDPRFLPLVRNMGLVEYWNRRGVTPDFLASAREIPSIAS